MAFERRDHGGPGDPQVAVALAEMPLICPLIGQSLAHEAAGAAAGQNARDGLRVRVDRLEGLLIGERGEVGGKPRRQHGAHLAQCEGTGEVEEVAQGSKK
jgi:hypothetical protein